MLRSKAEPQGDGTYKITGAKIFISAGEHDCAENIVHLVLVTFARRSRRLQGISLFSYQKFLVNADGSLGARNPIFCGAIEEKWVFMVIHLPNEFGWRSRYFDRSTTQRFERDVRVHECSAFGRGYARFGQTEVAYQNALVYAKIVSNA